MTVLEAGLRGAAMALLLLLAIVVWRDARHAAVTRYSVLIDLCAIAYLIESDPPIPALSPVWIVPIRLLSNTGPAAFQLWVAANFDDSFLPKWWRWLPFGGMIALASWAIATDWMPAWNTVRIAALLLVGVGILQTLAGRNADLIEGRRRFRLILAVGAGAFIVGLNVLVVTASEGHPRHRRRRRCFCSGARGSLAAFAPGDAPRAGTQASSSDCREPAGRGTCHRPPLMARNARC